VPAYLVDDAAAIDPTWLAAKRDVGVTAGASAPEALVANVVERLRSLGGGGVEQLSGAPESVNFPLPKDLA
jgi:4-hydroxy-3-methylbut-2-enyl diphosphate reductase